MNRFETPKSDLQFSPLPTTNVLAERKTSASAAFADLRDEICAAFETLEAEYGSAAQFARQEWQRGENDGGGGVMALMRGEVFEKVGVNISTVQGEFSSQFAAEIPGAQTSGGQFWASGISLVAHMKNPQVPAVHMNLRMICTGACWFGGVNDINAALPDDAITARFHNSLKDTSDRHNADYYDAFKDWCDKYFYLPHRLCDRGQGGIFYDYLDSGDWRADFAYTQAIGHNFVAVFPAIVRLCHDRPFDEADLARLLEYRGTYAEFNLLYDRGTRFGLQTGGNAEAILMSLPPIATW